MFEDLNPRHVMVRRLGYYALGLAIGLMALGFIQMGRKASLEQQAAKFKAEQAELAERARREAPMRGLPTPP